MRDNNLRYHAKTPVLKAGILPFSIHPTERLYLVAAPKAVRNTAEILPFAPARGTIRGLISGTWQDLRGADALALYHSATAIEPAPHAALQEAIEELGLMPEHISTLLDMGVLSYKDYGIHFFAAHIPAHCPLVPARDSAQVEWMSLSNMQQHAHAGTFNAKYIPIIHAIDTAVGYYSVF